MIDKVCFADKAAYSDSKYLAKGTIPDKILKDRAYDNAINSKYFGYQRRFLSMLYKFFDKKIGSGTTSKRKSNLKEVLAQELHKSLIEKSKRKKVYTRFKDNIWAAYLAEMGSLFS